MLVQRYDVTSIYKRLNFTFVIIFYKLSAKITFLLTFVKDCSIVIADWTAIVPKAGTLIAVECKSSFLLIFEM